MKVFFSKYHLHPVRGSSRLSRKGALLKVFFADGKIGYADCHPWPELGDAPLDAQLHALADGTLTPLTERSLAFAEIEASARKSQRPLFSDLTIPQSHYFLADLTTCDDYFLENLLKEGERTLKIKVGSDLDKESAILNHWLPRLSSVGCKLRLDFNCRLTEKQFTHFLTTHSSLLDCVEFFEDPFPYHPQAWQSLREKFKVALACDKESLRALEYPQSCDLLVVKPAVQDSAPFLTKQLHGRSLVVTSYLDHPIGQLAACYVASLAAQKSSALVRCGLLSHHAYELTSFSLRLTQQDSRLQPPLSGWGWGFDDLLEKLPWQVLK